MGSTSDPVMICHDVSADLRSWKADHEPPQRVGPRPSCRGEGRLLSVSETPKHLRYPKMLQGGLAPREDQASHAKDNRNISSTM